VLSVRGAGYVIAGEETLVVPLHGQGPRRPGRPSLSEIEDARRDDGTYLSASIPTLTSSIPVISDEDLLQGDDAQVGVDS